MLDFYEQGYCLSPEAMMILKEEIEDSLDSGAVDVLESQYRAALARTAPTQASYDGDYEKAA
jgi:hypothetical protein